MPDIQLLMLSTWSGRVATERRTRISCRLMSKRDSGKGAVACTLLWMRSMIFRPGCRGQMWGRYWCMWGCGPAGSQWDDQDGQAAAGSVKDCGVGQGCTLPGWGFLRLVGGQYRKNNYSRLPHLQNLRFRVRMFRMHGPQWNNTRIILTDARYPAIDAFCLVRTGGN
jgi:hypothetical protein